MTAVLSEEIDRRVGTLSQALRDCGLRLTHQRLEVVREIASTDEHPSVEAVYRGVSQRVPTISLDTVYRTLAMLTDMGLVGKVSSTSGVARYDANRAHHHHFVCRKCGSIRDVESSALDSVPAPKQMSALGNVESVEVNFRGICSTCARNECCC